MMKWIKHDTDANMDDKLQEVLLDYGLEGYGLYWYCIELVAGRVSKDNISFELKHDARVIARNTGSTPQKVSEMMARFVDLGLFEMSDNIITCHKLAHRLDQSMTSNPTMRKIISKIKDHDYSDNNHDPVMTQSGKVMQDKTRLDKTRLDLKDNVPIEDENKFDHKESFKLFWSKYPRKDDKKRAEAKFKTVCKTDDTFSELMDGLRNQIESKWDNPKFIPMPTTWLNGERWHDSLTGGINKSKTGFNINDQDFGTGGKL